ncbi:MAG: Smr/MutS family protein [Cellvibrionaceae bacterium]|nr:Smr/MutS family protein [Cellvibrionaceae bacterium]
MSSGDDKKKKRQLTEQDQALWEQVAKTVTPLKERPNAPDIKPRKMVVRKEDAAPIPDEWRRYNAPQPNSFVEKRTQRKIATGNKGVDRSIDLHGMNKEQAYNVLRSAIESGIRRGDKVLLVVTGKGGKRFSQLAPDTPTAYRTRDDFDQHGGVLKQAVPEWLSSHEMRMFVESFGPAAKHHGGDGALYVLLRKRFVRKRT